jgi:hypothetical protein
MPCHQMLILAATFVIVVVVAGIDAKVDMGTT